MLQPGSPGPHGGTSRYLSQPLGVREGPLKPEGWRAAYRGRGGVGARVGQSASTLREGGGQPGWEQGVAGGGTGGHRGSGGGQEVFPASRALEGWSGDSGLGPVLCLEKSSGHSEGYRLKGKDGMSSREDTSAGPGQCGAD